MLARSASSVVSIKDTVNHNGTLYLITALISKPSLCTSQPDSSGCAIDALAPDIFDVPLGL
jgi:hypothetical protein